MKPEMRHKLAQLPFEEKIRKVGELIRLSRKIGAERLRDDVQNFPQSAIRNPQSEIGSRRRQILTAHFKPHQK